MQKLGWVVVGIVIAFVAGSTLARGDKAQKPAGVTQSAGASQEIVVEGTGGGYEVSVSAQFVTVLYFHGQKVGKALASDQKRFTVSFVGTDAVAVRPDVGAPLGTQANLAIETSDLKVNVVLTVVEPGRAVSQVVFVRREEKDRFEAAVTAEVERRLTPIRDDYAKKTKEIEALVNEQVEREMAGRMMRRFEVNAASAVARTDANQVVRTTRAVVVGDNAYLFFTIQNRDASAYPVAKILISQDTGDVPARAFMELRAKDEATLVGKVPPDRTSAGVVVLPLARLAPGRALTVEWVPGGKAERVKISGLRVD
jgi:hypothetical protein